MMYGEICTGGNHLENVFNRNDRDQSGNLTQQETTAYVRSVTHGNRSSKTKRKRDKILPLQVSSDRKCNSPPLSVHAIGLDRNIT